MRSARYISILPFFLFLSCNVDESIVSKCLPEDSAKLFYEPLSSWIQPICVTNVPETKAPLDYRALVVYPNSIEELEALEKDGEIDVSYVPFGYEKCPDYQPEELLSPAKRLADRYKSGPLFKYAGICQEVDTFPKTTQIPPVYILWPTYKAIVDSLRYEEFTSYSVKDRPVTKTSNTTPMGRLLFYDATLDDYVPAKHIFVRICDGGYPETSYTDSLGYFSVPSWAFEHHTNISIKTESPLFRVIRNSPFTDLISLGSIEDLWANETDVPELLLSPTPSYIAYMSAQYYFYGNNNLLNSVARINSDYSTIRLYVDPDQLFWDPHPVCTFSLNGQIAEIYISNYYYYFFLEESLTMGNIFHALGHITHMVNVDELFFASTSPWIKESYASFFGWYNTYEYYSSLFTSPSFLTYCDQDNQAWPDDPSHTMAFTPFFVDLYDTFNESVSDPDWVNDQISYVPVYLINYAALHSRNLAECSSFLQGLTWLFYSADQLNDFLTCFSSLSTY